MKLVYSIISAVVLAPTLLSAAYYSCEACNNNRNDERNIGYYQSNYPSSGYQGNYYGGNQSYYDNQSYNGRYNQNFNDQYNNGQRNDGSQPFGGQYNQNYGPRGNQGGQYYRNANNRDNYQGGQNYRNGNNNDNNQGYYDPATGNSTPGVRNIVAQDTFKSTEDRELLKKIRQVLSSKRELNQGNVTIIIVDKKVQLQGQAGSKEDSAKIEETITSVEGVGSVDNQLDYPNKSTSWWNFGSSSNKAAAANEDNDHVLLERIQNAIESNRDAGNFEDVEVHVSKKDVTLSGSVDNEQIRKNLRNVIQEVEGVKTVNDQLTVNNKEGELAFGDTTTKTTANLSDSTIKTNVENKLRGGFFSKGFEQIEIIVNNGSVTAKGVVDSPDDIKTLTDRIQSVDGVRSIDNQAIVRKVTK